MSEENLFQAARKRRIFRTVAWYLAASWLILQVAAIVGDIWSLPAIVSQVVFLLLVIGLPIAIVLSWMYDASERGVRAESGDSFFQIVRRGDWRTVTLLVGFGVFLLILQLVGIAYFWPSEKLKPEILQVVYSTDSVKSHPENLNFGLFGVNAPRATEMYKYGRYRVSAYGATGSLPDLSENDWRPKIGFDDLCMLHDRGCLESGVAPSASVNVLLETNRELLRRYSILKGSRQFGEVIKHSLYSPVPRYRVLVIGNELRLRHAMVNASNGKPETALSILEEEMSFARDMFHDSAILVAKMVALSRIASTTYVYSWLMDRWPELAGNGRLPARLSKAERSLASVVRIEVDSYRDASKAMSKEEVAATRYPESRFKRAVFRILPYDRNATQNRELGDLLDLADASLLTAREFDQEFGDYEGRQPDTLDYLVNGAGSIFTIPVFPVYRPFMYRIHDVDALIRLLQVKAYLVRHEVDESTLKGRLASIPGNLRNPYDGSSPVYEDGYIFFKLEREQRYPVRLPFSPSWRNESE